VNRYTFYLAKPKENMSKTITRITIEVIGPKHSTALSAAIAKLQRSAFGLQTARGVTQVSVSIAQQPMDDLQAFIENATIKP
jgi:hypothetical protein